MGEIDRFNALVAAHSSQRACNRTWMPLFHWKLDGSLSNAFTLCEPTGMFVQKHQKFLEQVIMGLLEEGREGSRNRQPPTPITTLPKSRRGNHDWQDLKATRQCLMCRLDVQNRGFGREISGNSEGAPKTRGGCAICKVSLCRKGDCVKRFHDRKA